jgi:formylglycine-generating enzyme required for sulfatase activity
MRIPEIFRRWFVLPVACVCCALSAPQVWAQQDLGHDLYSPAKAVVAGQMDAAGIVPGKAGIQWVRIPGGTFMMGSADFSNAQPHRVTIKAFQMAKTMVTNKQYKACVEAGACTAPTDQGPQYDGDDQPVVGVEWDQAKAFAAWVGGRLPSEAEWEYAARSAGKDWKYPWGNGKATCDKAVIDNCAMDATMPVCSKPAGNTKQGLCDMAGNAWQWVEDWYSLYSSAPNDGSAQENPGKYRVFRGGSWGCVDTLARAAFRGGYKPAFRRGVISFRVARAS